MWYQQHHLTRMAIEATEERKNSYETRDKPVQWPRLTLNILQKSKEVLSEGSGYRRRKTSLTRSIWMISYKATNSSMEYRFHAWRYLGVRARWESCSSWGSKERGEVRRDASDHRSPIDPHFRHRRWWYYSVFQSPAIVSFGHLESEFETLNAVRPTFSAHQRSRQGF